VVAQDAAREGVGVPRRQVRGCEAAERVEPFWWQRQPCLRRTGPRQGDEIVAAGERLGADGVQQRFQGALR
jgi:hypothetical protein